MFASWILAKWFFSHWSNFFSARLIPVPACQVPPESRHSPSNNTISLLPPPLCPLQCNHPSSTSVIYIEWPSSGVWPCSPLTFSASMLQAPWSNQTCGHDHPTSSASMKWQSLASLVIKWWAEMQLLWRSNVSRPWNLSLFLISIFKNLLARTSWQPLWNALLKSKYAGSCL